MKHYLMPALCAALIAASMPASPACASSKSASISRIAVQHGHFVDVQTGKPFIPLGFNYYRVDKLADGKTEHAALLPVSYDPPLVETMMIDAHNWGFNTVRVFQGYYTGANGVLLSVSSKELNPDYIANIIDFLRKAKANGMHVIFTSDWSPSSSWLSTHELQTEEKYQLSDQQGTLGGSDFQYVYAGLVRTRANLIVEEIKAIREIDPSLLSVVLAWELQNESAFNIANTPFNQTAGTYRFAGLSYDLASDTQKQDLMDAISLQWANVCADAIHAADPHALVSNSVFTFSAVGRSGPAAMSTDKTPDGRLPFRPITMAQSRLDFVDIHTYAGTFGGRTVAENVRRDLTSSEWTTLKATLNELGKPVIAGECGFFTDQLHIPGSTGFNYDLGITMLKEHTELIKDAGFAGTLYWSYGSANSTSDDRNPSMRFHPEIARALTDVYRSNTK